MARPMLLAPAMRTLVLGILLVPSIAVANPISVGASLGLSQTKIDADNGADSAQTLGLFGRLGLSSRVAGQLEIMRYKTQTGCETCTFGSSTDIRTGTALLVVDLAAGSLVPTLLAGAGLDRDDGSFPTHGHHIEGGLGLEYRGEGGVTLGVDLRIGGRTIAQQDVVLDQPVVFFAPTQLQGGEYRSARVTLAVRF